MAKNEAKIQFTAECSDFNSAIKSANSEMQNLRAEMKLNEAQFQNTGDSAEYLEKKHELLQAQLLQNAEKQEALNQKIEVAKQIFGEDSDEVSKLERQLTYAQVEEQKLTTQMNGATEATKDQAEASDNAGSSVEGMADLVASLKIAETLKDIADAAIDMAQQFDDSEASIAAGTGAMGDDLTALAQTAKDAFSDVKDSSQDLVSMSDIAAELNTRWGVTGSELQTFTEDMSKFSKVTGEDGVTSVDNLSNIMKRWGIDQKDYKSLMDDIVTANQACQMSAGDLETTLSDNSTTFQELGYSADDALGFIVGLSDGGANVSSVMSGMKKAVTNLSGATDDVPGSFQAAIDAISNCGSVSEALNAEVGNTGLTIEDVFGSKAAQEISTAVLQGNTDIDSFSAKLQENEGIMDSTAESMTTNADTWSQATNNMSTAIGTTFSPVVDGATTKLSGFVNGIANIITTCPAAQGIISAFAGALGALAILGTVTAGFAGLSAVVGVLAGVFGTLLGPIALVVAAVGAIAGACVYCYNKFSWFRNGVNAAASALQSGVTTKFQGITSGVKYLGDVFGNMPKTLATAKQNALSQISQLKDGFNNKIQAIKGFFTGLKLKIPTPSLPKLPHFSLQTAEKTILGKTIKYPTGFGVSWNARMVNNPGILNMATVIGAAGGNLQIAGETTQPEMVGGVDKVSTMITNSVERAGSMINYDMLADTVAAALRRSPISMTLNGRELNRAL